MSAMLQLPENLTVRVLGPDDEPQADVLVSVQFDRSGDYYYGTAVGLSDDRGVVQAGGEQVSRFFAEDQQHFPMDYRHDLSTCDPIIRILVRGGIEFERARASVQSNTMIEADVAEYYRRATNAELESTEVVIDLSRRPSMHMMVDISTREIKRGP